MRHLGHNGLGASLKIISSGGDPEFNPETGEVEEQAPTVVNTTGVRMSVKQYLVNNDIVLSDDVNFYVAPEDVNGCPVKHPDPTDVIEFADMTYVIKDIKPWDFSGMVIGYKIHARVAS